MDLPTREGDDSPPVHHPPVVMNDHWERDPSGNTGRALTGGCLIPAIVILAVGAATLLGPGLFARRSEGSTRSSRVLREQRQAEIENALAIQADYLKSRQATQAPSREKE